MLYLKIAWRSLLRHKGKSIIIGTILFLAAFIMILGDATAIGMRRGVEKNIVESFTGHIILVSDEETKDNVLFTPMAKPLKILKDWDKIKWVLSQQDWIKAFIPMTRGGVMILGGQQMSFMLTFGCDFDDFQRVFGNPVSPVEGSLLTGADHGLMVNVDGRKDLYKFQGYWLTPQGADLNKADLTDDAKAEGLKLVTRDSLALEGFGEPNSTNMDVPIKGVVKFRSLNSTMHEITFMDIETYRQIFGYYTARDIVETIPAKEQQLMTASEDDLFGGGSIYSGAGSASASNIGDLEKQIRTETKVTHQIDYNLGAYNYVSILLPPGENLNRAVARMKQVAKDNDLPVKVLSWKTASGQVASTADILQSIVVVFVVLLFVVAIIIIMNTLSMNALERTEEFGMMRAVGARKGFITRMFLAETFSLSVIFGGGGILLGVIGTWIVRPLHITSGGNQIIELIFGGEVFQPQLGFSGLLIGIVGLAVVTVLAVIYPVLVARKITPLDAINRH
ncbi:MAG TPA: FtsX-like permease family protein [Spirochaetia bacterium]|nr:FtsX-like permease family protein [Spirochaetia bacterium]